MLSELMNSLFEFACVMEGSTPIDIQPINICNILRDALSESYGELESKGLSVSVDIPETPALCMGDKDALRRVLQNLFKNACTHGKDTLRVALNGNVIEIANEADGIDKLDTEQIFERFYTADASRTSKSTGLGLAIAKELVTRMGGQIMAETQGESLVVRVALQECPTAQSRAAATSRSF